MAGMGPPPKAEGQRRRRNATVAMTRLPAAGRAGDPPAWPLARPADGVESTLWTELWATPQAAAWERLGWTREVAQYVLWKALAEAGSLDASKEARQLADRLGLTPLAMLRLRWAVAPDEVGEQREASGSRKTTSRRRLKVVDPDAVAGT